MKIDQVSEFIWEHILEETSYGGQVRCLACGCVVLPDGDYLDLYVWDNGQRRCDEATGHHMVNLVSSWLNGHYPENELDPDSLAEIITMITKYTDNWGEQADLLRALEA